MLTSLVVLVGMVVGGMVFAAAKDAVRAASRFRIMRIRSMIRRYQTRRVFRKALAKANAECFRN